MFTRHFVALVLISATVVVDSACGDDPCLPIINADTSIIAAAENCSMDATSSTAADSTGNTTTVICEPEEPIIEPTCIAVPGIGDLWGKCIAGGTCTEGECLVSALGDICLPACDECGCPSFVCLGGTCSADGCHPQCAAVGDPCPMQGMVCDFMAQRCVWPGL